MDKAARDRPASLLALTKNSHVISKLKPKIRIVHIFAPEIIKTDVENFRELVQRLTGKPSSKRNGGKKATATTTMTAPGVKEEEEAVVLEEKDMELWKGDASGGFLSGFGDTEGFFQDFSDFPLLPLWHD